MADDDFDDDDETSGDALPATKPDTIEPGLHALTVAPDDAGKRLDRFLADRLAGMSRARLQALIRAGEVSGPQGPTRDLGAKVKSGDNYEVSVPPPEPAEPEPESIPLTVVFEDSHLLVIDKPAGLVVHPAAGHAQGTLVNALIAHCGDSLSGIGGVRRPGIVHRLDKDTSGLLVVAKSDAAHRGLSEQFAAHGSDGRMVRAYEALVWGIPDRQTGIIDANLGRSVSNRTRVAVVRGESGRHAVTHYEVVETFSDPDGRPLAARLRLVLETGRTHQIRAHLAHLGHPVMGDAVYGAGFKASARRLLDRAATALSELGRQALHAGELGFEHPITGRPQHFTSPRPADIEALHKALQPRVPAQKAARGKTSKSKISKR